MCWNCLLFWQQVICFKSLNLEQVTSKYSERLYLCLNNYHCNPNSKCNHFILSLNVFECPLECHLDVLHYICYKLTPLENHCSKAKVLLTLQPFLKILNISPLKDCCLVWQCFLNWFGRHEIILVTLKCFDSE